MCDKNLNLELEKAVENKNIEEIKALLAAGANVNMRATDRGGIENINTLLHVTYSAKIVNELLQQGARVNETNNFRETPLHAAITLGKDLEFVRVLLKHGADVNATNRKGNTALNHAVKRQSPMDIIEELLKYGADINLRNWEHRLYEDCNSSLDNAISRPNIAKLLIKYALILNFENDHKRIVNLDEYGERVSKLSIYINDCVCEIIKMKTDEIMFGVILYNFVKNNFDKLLLSNNSLCLRLSKIDYSVNYPIYCDIILDKIKVFLKRAYLLGLLQRTQIYSCTPNPEEKGKTIMLDPHSILYITEYLSLEDLFNLVFVSERQTIFTESDTDTSLDETSTSRDAKRARLL